MKVPCTDRPISLGTERATFVSLALYFLALSIPLFSSTNEDKKSDTWGMAWTGQAIFEILATMVACYAGYLAFGNGQRAIIAPMNFCFGAFCLGDSILSFGKANIKMRCSEDAQYAYHSLIDKDSAGDYDENTFTAAGVFIIMGCFAVLLCLLLNFLSCSNFDKGTKSEANFRGLVCFDLSVTFLFMGLASIYFLQGNQISAYSPDSSPATQGYGAAGFFTLFATLFALGAVYQFRRTEEDKFFYIFFISFALFCLSSMSICFAFLDQYRRNNRIDLGDMEFTHGFAGVMSFLGALVNMVAIFNAICKNNPNYKAGFFLISWTCFCMYYAALLWSMCKIFETCGDDGCTIDTDMNKQSSGFQAVMLLAGACLQLVAAFCSESGDNENPLRPPSYGKQNDI